MARIQYVFAQFLALLPRYEFQRIVNKYQGDFRIKKFKCWHQMAAMIFAQIRQEDSLRDIDIALNAHASKLYHIGIEQSPKSKNLLWPTPTNAVTTASMKILQNP